MRGRAQREEEAVLERARRGSLGLALLLGASLACLAAPQRDPAAAPSAVKVIEVSEPDGQILSYRFGSTSTDVRMRGTRLAPDAQIKLKVGSRPGFVEIDINRGDITGLKPAHQHGRDFLTYVLWAVSVDGKASNLGEITFDGAQPISINVTTPYQTFWLMLTAEPDYAVVDPSPQMVMYSAGRDAEPSASRALTIKGDLFYFTHYTTYETSPSAPETAPNELLQARKAVELASKTGVLAASGSPRSRLREEERTRRTLEQAKSFLGQAEDAYRKNARGREVVQFARTASQIAENARALARGAVGGVLVRQLEEEVARLRAENDRLRSESQPAGKAPADTPAEAPEPPVESPATPQTSASEAAPPLVARPIVWFGFLGWILALLLLFRRRNV